VKRRVFILAALAVCAAVPFDSIVAQRKKPDPCATDTTRWRFTVTPYFWATGIVGDVGTRARTAHIDLRFSKIFDNLDGAFMLPFEVSKGRIGIGAEVIYTRVSFDRATAGRGFTGASLTATQFIGEIAPRIQVYSNKKTRVDVLFGTRAWYLDNTVSLRADRIPDLTTDSKKAWWDRFAGARATYNITNSIDIEVRGDVGGFDSETTWQAIGGVGYTLSNSFKLRAGYRQLDVNYREGGNGIIYDVGLGGPIIGLAYRF
jgi:opacity protein-like surface antigen